MVGKYFLLVSAEEFPPNGRVLKGNKNEFDQSCFAERYVKMLLKWQLQVRRYLGVCLKPREDFAFTGRYIYYYNINNYYILIRYY